MVSIADRELGASVRSKLNQLFADVEAIGGIPGDIADLEAALAALGVDVSDLQEAVDALDLITAPYPLRSDLVTAWPVISALVPTGTVLDAGGQSYVKDGGTDIPDLSGLAPLDVYTVCHFGAGEGGDDDAAFSAAGVAVPALETMGPPNNTSTVPRSDTATIRIPAGEYTLTETVDAGNKDITWDMDPGAKINGSDFLNGRTTRAGLKVTLGYSYGILDANSGFVVTLGGKYSDKPGPITGVPNVIGLANYPQVDGVALIGAAYSRPALIERTAGNAAYTSDTVTVTPGINDDQLRRLRRGMVIETDHSPAFVGVLESWDVSDPSETVLTIQDGWYERGNTGAGVQTPSSDEGCEIGAPRKIWGGNFVTNLTADGSAKQAIGCEISSRNKLGDSTYDTDDTTNRVWGYLSATTGIGDPAYFKTQCAFIARGDWIYGYVSDDQEIGYYYKTVLTDRQAIRTEMPFQCNILQAYDTTGGLRYRIRGNGDVEHGDPAVAAGAGRFIAFRTSGLAPNYDVRLLTTGGTATDGNGQLSILGARVKVGTGAIEAASGFDLSTLAKGFMPPRMSTTARDALPAGLSGLVIWNFATSKLQVRTAVGWDDLH